MGNSTNNRNRKDRKFYLKLAGAVIAIGIWALIARLISSPLILPDPVLTFQSLLELAATDGFWLATGGTILRVLEAFLISAVLGIATGLLSGISPAFAHILSPTLTAIRATPVLALILVAMFWLPSAGVPILVALLMSFPVFHTAALAGMHAVDGELLEMASSFRVPPLTRLLRLRIPAARGHLLAGAKNALGLSWKVVVAGEIISQPRFALGTAMQDARLSLETRQVLAWAIVTILLCGATEYLLGLAVRRFTPNPAINGSAE